MRCICGYSISQVIILVLCSSLFLFYFQNGVAAKIVFGSNGLYVMNDNGGARRQLTDKDDSRARWSPDGTRIVFQRNNANNDQISDVYLIHADGTNLQQLTHYGGITGNPAWSPDGQNIVFHSNHTGELEIYITELATGNVTQLTGIKEAHNATAPDCSPDGQRIVYNKSIKRQGLNHKNFWVMNIDGTNHKPLLPDPKLEDPILIRSRPRWSPDGRRILFTETTGEWNSRIVIATIGGGMKVLDLKEKLGDRMLIHGTWMDNGQSILLGAELYEDAKKNLDIYHFNIYRYELETGRLRKLTRNTSVKNTNPDWVSGVLSVSPVGKKNIIWGKLKQNSIKP